MNLRRVIPVLLLAAVVIAALFTHGFGLLEGSGGAD
jgi:hypothetical protein